MNLDDTKKSVQGRKLDWRTCYVLCGGIDELYMLMHIIWNSVRERSVDGLACPCVFELGEVGGEPRVGSLDGDLDTEELSGGGSLFGLEVVLCEPFVDCRDRFRCRRNERLNLSVVPSDPPER